MAKPKRAKRKDDPIIQVPKSWLNDYMIKTSRKSARMHTPITLLIMLDHFGMDVSQLREYLESYMDYLRKAIHDEQWLEDVEEALDTEYDIRVDYREIK